MPDASVTPRRKLRHLGQWRTISRWVLRGTLVVVGFLLAGNLAILSAHGYAWATFGKEAPVSIEGLHNLRAVDDHVWRGKAPGPAGYEGLADAGVTTVVDLRAERDLTIPTDLLEARGVTLHRLPIRDGQTPSTDEVEEFLDIVGRSDGLVYVHCGAGVGRTGAMAAAYLVRTGQANPREALRRNLAVGPPSLEQIWYASGLDIGAADSPPAPVKWVSRFLDAPRRIWTVANL